jgi:hypothetical protein
MLAPNRPKLGGCYPEAVPPAHAWRSSRIAVHFLGLTGFTDSETLHRVRFRCASRFSIPAFILEPKPSRSLAPASSIPESQPDHCAWAAVGRLSPAPPFHPRHAATGGLCHSLSLPRHWNGRSRDAARAKSSWKAPYLRDDMSCFPARSTDCDSRRTRCASRDDPLPPSHADLPP